MDNGENKGGPKWDFLSFGILGIPSIYDKQLRNNYSAKRWEIFADSLASCKI